jgi:ubiquinone/menaquinone biosynthesis C-methylase UbiE
MTSGVSHPVFAQAFPAMSGALETGIAGRRQDLLAGLAGQVIDVGAGTGPSFGHYPAAVTRVLPVEPEPRLRALAAAAARAAPVPVQVAGSMAGALPAADASFDAAVVSFVLCTVPDQHAALAEIRRVLRPGGTLCFLEHVRADAAGLVRMQRALEATVWPRLFGGCHLSRDTAAAIERAGFTMFLFPAARSRSTSPGTAPHRAGSSSPCGQGQLHGRVLPRRRVVIRMRAAGRPGAGSARRAVRMLSPCRSVHSSTRLPAVPGSLRNSAIPSRARPGSIRSA